MKYYKYYIVITIFIILISSSYFLYNTLNDNSSKVTANTRENQSNSINRLAANTIAYGLENTKGEYIDNGSTLNQQNNSISVNVSIDHNLDENRDYGLIVLEDFKQVPFKIEEDEQEFTKYIFSMSPNTSKDIKVTFPVNLNAQEVTFLVIKKPNYKLKEMDFNRAAILEEVLSMRYPINQAKKRDNVKETEPDNIINDGLNENMFVTKDKKKLQAVFEETEEKELSFSVGNDTEQPMRYAIVAFRDWEQNEIINNQDVIYTTVPSGVRQIFDFNLPNVDKETNFQLIALPFPYEVSKENYISQQAFGSFRIVIQNKD
ncbi:hypothetical protein SFC55_27030 [Niallia taxi]|uniref:hypothetical protein n=1 Tax=Niallia taxi TaxID=2499688 RepID=UPI003981BD5B